MGRPGVGHLVFGLVLLGAGVAVTLSTDEVFWYGAFVVGGLEVVRGIYLLIRSSSSRGD